MSLGAIKPAACEFGASTRWPKPSPRGTFFPTCNPIGHENFGVLRRPAVHLVRSRPGPLAVPSEYPRRPCSWPPKRALITYTAPVSPPFTCSSPPRLHASRTSVTKGTPPNNRFSTLPKLVLFLPYLPIVFSFQTPHLSTSSGVSTIPSSFSHSLRPSMTTTSQAHPNSPLIPPAGSRSKVTA